MQRKVKIVLTFLNHKQEVDEEDDEEDEDDPNREFADVPTHAVQILLEEEEGECDDLEVGRMPHHLVVLNLIFCQTLSGR